MSSQTKKNLTVNRTKALQFLTKQDFWKMETMVSKKRKNSICQKEVEWARRSNDNASYAKQMCSFIINRYTELLQESIQQMSTMDPKRSQLISKHNEIQQSIEFHINTKIKEFYKTVGIKQKYEYQYQYNTESLHLPSLKRTKLSHPNSTNDEQMDEKTKQENDKEKLEQLNLPRMLLNSNKLQQWLDDKLNILNEYESLVRASNKNKKELESAKNCSRLLRRDMDILKSTVLQQSSNILRENVDLKRVYLDIVNLEKCLPKLRMQKMKPLLKAYMLQFQECDVRKTIKAQNDIKQMLGRNKFNKKMEMFGNIYNKHAVQHLLFESEINGELNDDLDLLRDFGVKFHVETLKKEKSEYNLKVIFEGHFGKEIDNEWKPPNLVVMLNENEYEHYYQMLPGVGPLDERFMDFVFVLKDKRGIKRRRNDADDDDVKMDDQSRFEEKHIKWLNQYKANTLKSNGEFVSIVCVYNFYIEAVKMLIKEICNVSMQKK